MKQAVSFCMKRSKAADHWQKGYTANAMILYFLRYTLAPYLVRNVVTRTG